MVVREFTARFTGRLGEHLLTSLEGGWRDFRVGEIVKINGSYYKICAAECNSLAEPGRVRVAVVALATQEPEAHTTGSR